MTTTQPNECEIDMTTEPAVGHLSDAVYRLDPRYVAAYYVVLIHDSGERVLVIAVTDESYRADRPEYRVDSVHRTQSATLTRILGLFE